MMQNHSCAQERFTLPRWKAVKAKLFSYNLFSHKLFSSNLLEALLAASFEPLFDIFVAGYLVDDGFDLGIRLQRSICSLLAPKTLAAPCRKVAQAVFDCEVVTKGTPNEHVCQRQLATNGVPCRLPRTPYR